MRIRTRIRSFVWASALPNPFTASLIGTQHTWGPSIIAAANEDNEIIFIAISSPNNMMTDDLKWSAQVLKHFSVIPGSEGASSVAGTFDEIIQQQSYISHIAWSPWMIEGNSFYSVLVYATNDDIRARVVTYCDGTMEIGVDEIVYHDIQLRHGGPMEWSPRIEHGYKVTLAVFTTTGVTFLTISALSAAILAQRSHKMNDRYDEITGVAWEFTEGDPILHFCSSQSTLTQSIAGLRLSQGDEVLAIPSPNWREQMSDSQALFSAQHELKGYARTKAWGLSTSSVGDFIATCSSIHPSDMIEYGPPADRRSTIAISGLRTYDQKTTVQFPEGNFSAEGVAFTLEQWLEIEGEGHNLAIDVIERIANDLAKAHWTSPQSTEWEPVVSFNDPKDIQSLILGFKQNVFLEPHTVSDRCHILVSQICSFSASSLLQRALISFRLAKAVVGLPLELSRAVSFSTEIRQHHNQVIRLIQVAMNEEQPSELGDETDDEASHPHSTAEVANGSSAHSDGSAQLHDTCGFCQASIPFTDLTSATCANGHRFPRCGLSFVVIQAPRITKYCGVCKTPFLDDRFIRAQEVDDYALHRHKKKSTEGQLDVIETIKDKNGAVAGTDTTEDVHMWDVGEERFDAKDGYNNDSAPLSLAKLLFLACDACIYCGGKFTG